MKKKFLYISFLLAAMSFTSCEDFLTVDSPSSFDQEYLFSNTDDAYKMVLGAYAPFAQDPYTSRMSNAWMQNTDVEAMSVNDKPNGAHRMDVWSLEAGILQGWKDIESAWNNSYLAIDRANQCIEGITNSALYKSGDPIMKQLLGESYCIRAYWYFMLCNFWGDVPFSTEPSNAERETNTPKVDKNIIYAQCIQDLIDHEEDMKWASEITVERMSRDFAMGMIVRLSMFRAGYSVQADGSMKRPDDYRTYLEIAKKYAEKLINSQKHTLSSDFKKIFKDQCEFIVNNDEDIIFEVGFVKNGGGDVGWCIGRAVRGGSYGATTLQVALTPNYYYSFDKQDLRRDVTCGIEEYQTDVVEKPVNITGIMPVKWCRLWLKESPGSTATKSTGINWPVMRYSDILLMYAEAENELNGPTDIAKNALKDVRRRAFDPSVHAEKVDAYVNNLGSSEDFFNAIVNERAWEFGGEGLRRFDLVRWNLYGKKIMETVKAHRNMGRAAVGLDLENPEVAQYASLASELYYTLVKGTSPVTGKESTIVKYLNDPYTKLQDDEKPATTVSKYDDLKADDGKYVKLNWTSYLIQTVKDADGNEIKDGNGQKVYEDGNYVKYTYRGYKGVNGTEPVPYLLPIPYSITSASKGVLSNDGYGLVLTMQN